MLERQPPLTSLIDSHCHLDAAELAIERDQLVAEAQAAGLAQILVPSVKLASFADTLAMRERYGAWIAFGLHPMYLAEHLDAHLEQLDQWLSRHRPEALGEIGLDFYLPDLDAARQETLFAEQLRLARHHQLPVLLHVRRSQDRVLKYLRQVPGVRGIAHAFNGSEQQAQAFIEQGCKLGFGGAMSYSGSQRIRRLAASLPLSAIVLETDAPDMQPSWATDVPNRPANVAHYAQLLAELRAEPLLHITRQTTHNVLEILGKCL